MDGLLTIAPAALLALGAGASALPSARLGRWRHVVPVAAAAGAFGGAIAAAWWTLPGGGRPPLTLTLLEWSRAAVPGADPIFHISPGLDVDFLAALALVVVAALGGMVALRAVGEAEGEAARALSVVAASALFVAATRNPLGLVVGWLVLDAVLVWLGAGRNSLVVGQIGLLLAIVGLAGLPSDATVLGVAPLAPGARLALVLAAMIRAGAYPLWWAIPRTSPTQPWEAIGLRLAPTVAGLGLAFRVSETLPRGGGIAYTLFAPALLAFGVAALLSFHARHRAACLDWRVAAHVGLVLAALGLGDPVGRAIALVLVLDLAATFAARYAAEGLGAAPVARAARGIADFGAMGLPPTLGFAGRWLLFNEILLRFSPDASRVRALLGGTAPAGDVVLLRQFAVLVGIAALLVAAAAFATAPMRDDWFPPPALPRGVRRTGAIVLGVALGGIAMGLALERLAPGFEALTGAALPSPLRLALSSSPWPFLLIVAAPPLGWWLRRSATGGLHLSGAAPWRWLRLLGVVDAIGATAVRFGAFVQLRSGLVEGRRSMALTAIGALATGAALFARTPPRAAPGPAPDAATLATVGLAAVAGGLIVLARPAAARLGGLALAYGVAALVLLRADVAPVIVAVKLLVGLLVVAMLALSVLQAPIDRRLVRAARRLRAIGAPAAPERVRVVAALALATFAVAALGLAGGEIRGGPSVPPELLRPAVVLLAGGILAAVFADGVLELAAGVLLALVGAEMIYARIDAGLVVTGALAVFQMLFALVASFFLGLAAATTDAGPPDAEAALAAEARSARPEVPS